MSQMDTGGATFAAERDKRVAWLRDYQRTYDVPAVALWWCAGCQAWTVSVAGTPNVRCGGCGTTPAYQLTVQGPPSPPATPPESGEEPA